MKVGVLGCGMIAEWGHLPAIQKCDALVLEAVFDIRWERALAMQHRFHAKHAFPSEETFWKSDIDAVVICTPAPLHLDHVKKAAAHGKHVLCEKPLAMNEADILEMIDVASKAGIQLYTGFTYRFSPSASEIHKRVRAGEIGELRALRLIYLWNLHGKWQKGESGELIPSRLRQGRMDEGGPLVDCGVHQIDLARWWLGSEVDSYRGIGVWMEDFEAPDHLYLHMGHECGAHSMVEMSFSYNATSKEPRSEFRYELIGTDGVIRYHREERSFELRNSHGTQFLAWHPEKNFYGMYQEFAHALHTKEARNMPSATDGLLATRIARTATEQAIAEREPGSSAHHSSMSLADVEVDFLVPGDSAEPPMEEDEDYALAKTDAQEVESEK